MATVSKKIPTKWMSRTTCYIHTVEWRQFPKYSPKTTLNPLLTSFFGKEVIHALLSTLATKVRKTYGMMQVNNYKLSRYSKGQNNDIYTLPNILKSVKDFKCTQDVHLQVFSTPCSLAITIFALYWIVCFCDPCRVSFHQIWNIKSFEKWMIEGYVWEAACDFAIWS